MKNIFIDCGANLGQGYERLKAKGYIPADSEIYMFEPLKNAYAVLKQIYPNATIFNNAVWIENKETTFNIETAPVNNIKDTGHASNIMGDKFNFKNSSNNGWRQEIVKSIDFIEFIITNFKRDDNIFVKFDIEGAEYEILDKLIETKTYEYIKTLNIEFHGHLRTDVQNLKHHSQYFKFFNDNNIKIIQEGLTIYE